MPRCRAEDVCSPRRGAEDAFHHADNAEAVAADLPEHDPELQGRAGRGEGSPVAPQLPTDDKCFRTNAPGQASSAGVACARSEPHPDPSAYVLDL